MILLVLIFSFLNTLGAQQNQVRITVQKTPDQGEVSFGTDRKKQVEKTVSAWRAKNKQPLKKTPSISCVISGAGMRTRYAALGLLSGLESIEFLGNVERLLALSGASWAALPWILSGESITHYKTEVLQEHMREKNSIFSDYTEKLNHLLAREKEKKENKLTLDRIDFFGSMLSDLLLNTPACAEYERAHDLSQLTAKLNPKIHPYPLFLACTKRENADHDFIEFSPHTAALTVKKFFNKRHQVPVASFGSRFEGGAEVNKASHITPGYLMGLWGSSFAGIFNDYVMKSARNPSDNTALQKIEKRLSQAPFAGHVPNMLYGYNSLGLPDKSKPVLEIIDSLYDDPLPLAPLYGAGRQNDLIILADFSDKNSEAHYSSLKKIKEKYALPDITQDNSHGQKLSSTISYYKSSKTGVPSLLYIWLGPVLQKRFPADRVVFTSSQARSLVASLEQIIAQNKSLFVEAMGDL